MYILNSIETEGSSSLDHDIWLIWHRNFPLKRIRMSLENVRYIDQHFEGLCQQHLHQICILNKLKKTERVLLQSELFLKCKSRYENGCTIA